MIYLELNYSKLKNIYYENRPRKTEKYIAIMVQVYLKSWVKTFKFSKVIMQQAKNLCVVIALKEQ